MKQLMTLVMLLSVHATLAANWSNTSISFLRGNNFKLGTQSKTEVTLEHASAYNYGDNFFWFDITDPQNSSGENKTEIYGEWSPRFSLGKIFGFYDENRFIKDVLQSNTIEWGRNTYNTAINARLFGIGFDLNIPYFKFFQINFYLRDTLNKSGTSFQTTAAYLLPFSFSEKFQLSWGGYFDHVIGDEGSESDNTLGQGHFQSGQQLLLDVGNIWNSANTIFMGFEYQYWNRKYGIKGGPVENNLKYMAKWVF